MESEACRKTLAQIAEVLAAGHEDFYANAVRDALSGPEEKLHEFLVSNKLWGGPGSIADSAFAYESDDPFAPYDPNGPNEPVRKKNRATFENLMIQLGRAQIAAGQVNIRTSMWVEAFEDWRDKGLR